MSEEDNAADSGAGLDSSDLSKSPGGAPKTRDLLERQNRLLESIQQSIEPDEIEGRIRKLVTKFLVVASFVSGAVLGTYEFIQYLSEQWETRSLLNNWVEVSRQAYEEDLNAEVALAFLASAEEMAPQSPKIVRLKAYIAGMEVAEELLNLDRPMNQDELDRAALAIGQANLLIQVDGQAVDGWLLKGQIYAALGQADRASKYLQDALLRDPDHAMTHVRLALVEWREAGGAMADPDGDGVAEAMRLLERAASLEPGAGGEKWARLWLGVIQMETLGDVEACLESFGRALEIDPRFHLALLNMATLHDYLDDGPEVYLTLWQYLKLKPGDDKAWTQLATRLGYENAYIPALGFATRATNTDPSSFNAWELRGLLEYEIAKESFLRTGELDEEMIEASRASAGEALLLDPMAFQVYINRAKLERQFGDLARAGDNARQAASFAPEDSEVQEEIARYELMVGNFEQALVAATSAADLAPDEADEAHRLQAVALRRLGRLEEASAALDVAMDLSWEGTLPRILLERAELHRAAGRLEDADAALAASLEADPKLIEAAIRRLDLAAAMEDVERAGLALASLRSLAPEHVRIPEWEAAAMKIGSSNGS